ncbi:MAG TPA: amidohydrolase [Allosphingosinicella sp.]|nr:amidohydrolase [Allosphingosinicella sp.]
MGLGTRRMRWALGFAAALASALASALAAAQPVPRGLVADPDPFPSTYSPAPSVPTAIVGAHILTGTGADIPEGTILMRGGRIEAVGAGLAVPAGYRAIDGHGRWVTPGIIDAHSHIGAEAAPTTSVSDQANEDTSPNTAEVWVEHSIWPQDPQFRLARAGGVTTLMILPGSDNLFGGRTITLRNVPATTVQAMKFPGAPYGLKMACGENPIQTYGSHGRAPATRMAEVAGYRRAWIAAAEYRRRWQKWRGGGERGDPPARDLQLETLAGVLDGKILVHNHCYRSDEMAVMIDIANEFGFRITAFHHALEAYKIAPLLAREGICVATWASSWGSKMEALDAVEENAAMIDAAGGCAVIKSDDPILGQRLNQEAGIAMTAGRRAGIDISEGRAIRWITLNAAHMLGIDRETGSLEPGKRADVALWSADPFSVYALADTVWLDGAPIWDRRDPSDRQPSDFLLGEPGQEQAR